MKYFKSRIKSSVKRALYLSGFLLDRALGVFSLRGKSDIILRSKGCHVFFGYYDISPFSEDGRRVLACRTGLDLTVPASQRKIEFGYYDLSQAGDKLFYPFAEGDAWCWQQGSRLQWMPGHGDGIVFFNDRSVSGAYEGVLFHIGRKEDVKRLVRPLYDISRDEQWGLSLNFSRLQRLRPGYGYHEASDSTANDPVPSGACIEVVNIEGNIVEWSLGYERLLSIDPRPDMVGAAHYVNHLSFSPSGKDFIFFHMWVLNGKRFSRLFLAGRESRDLTLLNNFGKCSHYAWNGDSQLLMTCAAEHGGAIGYYLYDLTKPNNSPVKLGANILLEDGHPSFLPGGHSFLTDTYPNRLGRQTLKVFDLTTNRLTWSRSLFRSRRYAGEVRCDLHPRLDRTATLVCVDDEFKTERVMRVISLNI